MTQEIRENTQNHAIDGELDAILAQLTTEQIRFLIARCEAESDTAACREVNISRNTVSHWSQETRDLIAMARMLMAQDGVITAMHIRRRNLAKAMAVKVKGLDSGDERLRQNVATELIEWELGKATQRQELAGPEGGPLQHEVIVTWDNVIQTDEGGEA